MRSLAWGAMVLGLGISGCGGAGSESNGVDPGGGAVDTTAPSVSSLSVSALGDGAVVAWTTDEASRGVLYYGDSPVLDELASTSDELALAHSVVLSGLVDGQQYFLEIESTDASGNTGRSETESFVQGEQPLDADPPQLSSVQVATTTTTAVLSWTTNEAATSGLEYGLTSSYGTLVTASSELASVHRVELADLRPLATYHFRVSAQDAAGNVVQGADMTFAAVDAGPGADGALSGELVAWHPIALDFAGPSAGESDISPNPFTDYRYTLELQGPSGQQLVVPGYFDGDGAGGDRGTVWRARFAVDEGGSWSYVARFVQGAGVAISADAGVPSHFDGTTGSFTAAPRDAAGDGFYRHGVLEYVGEHYLKFRDGSYFLKGGTDSPENLLGYAGFDNTFDQPGGVTTQGLVDGLHRFESHAADFGAGGLGDGQDPVFASADSGELSRGIVGALNYLSSEGVNSIYFQPLNLEGAGRDTYPYVGAVDNAFNKSHFDLSKLHQWDSVVWHAQRRGILLHVVLSEFDSNGFLDDKSLGPERKLFLREIVARFSHALAIKWNLSEESGFSQAVHEETAGYIRSLDPYKRPVAFHTAPLEGAGEYAPYSSVLGDERFQAASLHSDPEDHGRHTETWRSASAAAGQPWVVEVDEQASLTEGLTDANAATLRKTALWDAYFSGAAGIEWYAGDHSLPLGGDMNLEDFRTREEMWRSMRVAREFMEAELPFWEMQPHDLLVSGEDQAFGGAEVFAKLGEVYAVYYPNASVRGTLDLTGAGGVLSARWFNPREGAFSDAGQSVTGGGLLSVPAPPTAGAGAGEDPVFLEDDGLVVMEVESMPAIGFWVEETTHAGFTGSSYYRWDGPNSHSSAPGQGRLRYRFQVNAAGNYRVSIHNRHNAPQADQENDCWARMNGGSWKKIYSNQGSSTVKKWNWHSNFDPDHVGANYNLSPGVNELEITGRSSNFMIDRIHVYRAGLPGVLDTEFPESSQSGGGADDVDEDWVLLIKR